LSQAVKISLLKIFYFRSCSLGGNGHFGVSPATGGCALPGVGSGGL